MGVSQTGELLRFEKASKTFVDSKFRKTHALENVSLSIQAGEFIAILGPSGCGKSTMLRLAAGLDSPTSGTVTFRGEPVTGPSPERGLVFQAYNSFPWLTVRQNIAFGLASNETPKQREEVSKWLAVTGLNEFAEAYPKVLSGGMRQRMALARTMIVKPQLVLLDEPFGALDERTRNSMQQLLLQVVADSGCTVVFVTHDIREAILLSDRVILLTPRPGQIAHIFEPKLTKPKHREQMTTGEFGAMYDLVLSCLED